MSGSRFMNKSSAKKYDSDFCGNLPIHNINVVQPYGALIVADKEGNICQVSENCAGLFGEALADIVNKPASKFFDLETLVKQKPGFPQSVEVQNTGYQCIFHEYPDYYIIEINLDSRVNGTSASFVDVYHDLKASMEAIEECNTFQDMLQVAAKELKKASGFDKVMIYRFDENWNGHVLAEEREDDMESYLGLTFPASDVPKQARELYLRNPYRFIPDKNYQPVKLYPVINPITNSFLDMTDCNLRGVATVHLEYLTNMKVTASMSTRIIRDGRLWGLIACHHKTPMRMSFKVCTTFELLSGIISSRTSTIQSREIYDLNTHLSGIYTSLVEETYRSSDLVNSLLLNNNVLELFNAGGIVISYNGNVTSQGNVPEANEVEDLILWLSSKTDDEAIYATDNLSDQYEHAAGFKDIASGLLAIEMDRKGDDFILVFRPEVKQVINWGGDPETRINFDADMKSYHPRSSFRNWQQEVAGVAEPWNNAEFGMAENLRDFIKAYLNGKNYSYKK